MAVSNGTLEAAGTFAGFFSSVIPEAKIEVGLPFLWEQPREQYDAFYHRGLFKILSEVYAEHNIRHLGSVFYDSIYGFALREPIYKPGDFKGKKIRALHLAADWVAHYGASPVVIPGAELYMALKLGTIDGVHFGPSSLEDYKLGEIAKYYLVEPETGATNSNVIVNMDAWKALPEDIKHILDKYSQTILLREPFLWNDDNKLRKAAKKYGVEPIHWSKEDLRKTYEYAINVLWQKAAASPRCAKMVDICREQARDLGRID